MTSINVVHDQTRAKILSCGVILKRIRFLERARSKKRREAEDEKNDDKETALWQDFLFST